MVVNVTTGHQRIMAMIKASEEERKELLALQNTNRAALDRLVLKIWNEKVAKK